MVTAASVSGAAVVDASCPASPPATARDPCLGSRRLPHHRHRPRRPPRRRRPPRATLGRRRGVHGAIEWSIGWLMHRRRLARDYEMRPHRSEAMRDDRLHGPPPHRRSHPELARNLTRDQTRISGPNAQSGSEVTEGSDVSVSSRARVALPYTPSADGTWSQFWSHSSVAGAVHRHTRLPTGARW
jgi:hypothetical protein